MNFIQILTEDGKKKFYKEDIIKCLERFDKGEPDKTSPIFKMIAERLYNSGQIREEKEKRGE
jgi:hypothetical protein